jgi:putative transposase
MCRALQVNRTSFHDWERRAPSDRTLTDAWLTEKVKQIHAASDGTYGARRVHAELRLEHGIRVGRKRVERLMKAAGISGLLARKRRRTTVRLPGVRVAPDLVERDFRPNGPDQTWSADITYISTWEGFLYLAHVQDLFSRLIVGWSMAEHLRSELVVDALEMALARRRPDPGLVHHSDQGCQGGFKRSSQHSIKRSCDGQAERVGCGADGAGGDAIAGSAVGGAAGASGAVLGGDRSRAVERGRRPGGGRVGGRWRPMVQGGWRDAALCDPDLAVGALPVLR